VYTEWGTRTYGVHICSLCFNGLLIATWWTGCFWIYDGSWPAVHLFHLLVMPLHK